MQMKIYTLPEVNFIAGEEQQFVFNMVDNSGNDYYTYVLNNDTESDTASEIGIEVDFSICPYSTRTEDPLVKTDPLTISFTVDKNDVDDPYYMQCNFFEITLPSTTTVTLYGKYIYQVMLRETYYEKVPHGMIGDPELKTRIISVCQGIMNITRNIHTDYITSTISGSTVEGA